MIGFFDVYNSVEDLYLSILKGNEVEFIYKEQRYFLLPVFTKKAVTGVRFGKAYTDREIICLSSVDLFNASIEDTVLGKVISQIRIVWYNF